MFHGIRILIIGINYTPELTGIGRYSGEMGAWLAQRGATVQVVTGFPYYPEWKVGSGYRKGWYAREAMNGVSVLRCPIYVPGRPTPVQRILQDLSFFLTSLIAIIYLKVRGHKFDQIWVASPSFLSGWVGQVARWFSANAHLQLHVFDLPIDAARALGMIRGRWLLRLLSGLESSMMIKYDRISTLSAGMRDQIIRKGVKAESVILLPIWVDINRFQPGYVDQQLLERLGIASEKRIVLYSGAVGEKQGLENMLALAGLMQSAGRNDLQFVMAGEGPYVDTLKKSAEDQGLHHLRFIPLQCDEAFPKLLNSAWLHLVLQRDTASEHFMPSKLIPILTVGGLALVTATTQSSLGKLIKEHKIAVLVDVNDPLLLFQTLNELMESPENCQILKKNARQFALDSLNKDALLERYWTAVI
jgi:colanic acid biosynthesis glycosyl transferase WcaI